jgi:tellurite resistance protein TerC
LVVLEIGHNQAYGHELAKTKVLEYFTGYVLEKSLAVDNIFVFFTDFFLLQSTPSISA